jgi:hypothetical protein
MAMPLYIVLGKTTGQVMMFDIRMLTPVAQSDTKKSFKQFEVHRHLPFAMGATEPSVFTLSFGDGLLTPTVQAFQGTVNNFALHESEAACAVRTGNRITYVDVPLSL